MPFLIAGNLSLQCSSHEGSNVRAIRGQHAQTAPHRRTVLRCVQLTQLTQFLHGHPHDGPCPEITVVSSSAQQTTPLPKQTRTVINAFSQYNVYHASWLLQYTCRLTLCLHDLHQHICKVPAFCCSSGPAAAEHQPGGQSHP